MIPNPTPYTLNGLQGLIMGTETLTKGNEGLLLVLVKAYDPAPEPLNP